jgi:tetratricopeptide (TPR) repeat protein
VPEEWRRDADGPDLRAEAGSRPPRPERSAQAQAPAPTPASPVARRRDRPKRPPPLVAEEIERAVGTQGAAKAQERLAEAAATFERDRPQDALRMLRPLLRDAPDVPAVRELAGLASYRLGRWAEAARHLEAFRAATGSVEGHAVLADSYRALGRFRKVDELWDELRAASPAPPLMAEGRIVAAGAMADRGDVKGAIRLLERGPLGPRRAPQPYHLRLWYALADLCERGGDTPRARELFRRVVDADPDMADAAERLHALR